MLIFQLLDSIDPYALTDASFEQLDERDAPRHSEIAIGECLAIDIRGTGTIGHASAWEHYGITFESETECRLN